MLVFATTGRDPLSDTMQRQNLILESQMDLVLMIEKHTAKLVIKVRGLPGLERDLIKRHKAAVSHGSTRKTLRIAPILGRVEIGLAIDPFLEIRLDVCHMDLPVTRGLCRTPIHRRLRTSSQDLLPKWSGVSRCMVLRAGTDRVVGPEAGPFCHSEQFRLRFLALC